MCVLCLPPNFGYSTEHICPWRVLPGPTALPLVTGHALYTLRTQLGAGVDRGVHSWGDHCTEEPAAGDAAAALHRPLPLAVHGQLSRHTVWYCNFVILNTHMAMGWGRVGQGSPPRACACISERVFWRVQLHVVCI